MNPDNHSDGDRLGLEGYKRASQPTPSGESNIFAILALEEEIRGHERVMSKLKRTRKSLLSGCVIQSQSRVIDENNLDPIRNLEEQITEHRQLITGLKRSQNSLLNIFRLPPEILGDIFRRSAIPEDTFGGFKKRSHNFLFVCRHWYEVASCTSYLWNFWGNNPRDWAERSRQYPVVPVDLVLDGLRHPGDILDATVQNVLESRATEDTIRRIHLIAGNSTFIGSVISPLTAKCRRTQSSSVESIIIRDESESTSVDLSNFFVRCRFAALRRLELLNCKVSSFNLVASQTCALTSLDLDLLFQDSTPPPTTTQLLSLLASNPSLRKVRLMGLVISDEGGRGPPSRVPLHHLRELDLSGDIRTLVDFLRRLDHAKNVNLTLLLRECAIGDISRLLGPYVQGYLQGRDRSLNGLGFGVSWENRGFDIDVGDAGKVHLTTPGRGESFMLIMVHLNEWPPKNLLTNAILGLIADTPREEIVSFKSRRNLVVMEDVYAHLPNLESLYLTTLPLSVAFPRPILDGTDTIPPSLQHIYLAGLIVDNDEWGLLTTFLSRRAASGSKLNSLVIVDSSDMASAVVENIRSLVGEFRIECSYHQRVRNIGLFPCSLLPPGPLQGDTPIIII